MRCKACNVEMKNASDIYWREVEDGIRVMEDLCMNCRRKSYSTKDQDDYDTEEEIWTQLGYSITKGKHSDE